MNVVVTKCKRNFSANTCEVLNGTDNILEGFTRLPHFLRHIYFYSDSSVINSFI